MTDIWPVLIVAAACALIAAWARWWPRRKPRTRLSRQLALGSLEDAMGQAEADPGDHPAAPEPRPLLYAANGSAHHYARPGARRPLCAAGAREGAVWLDGQGGERQLPLCGHCRRIDAARAKEHDGEGGAP